MKFPSFRLALATLAATTLGVVVGQAPAAAALPSDYSITVSTTFHGSGYSESYSREFEIYSGNGAWVGTFWFQADPANGAPGDALKTCDMEKDGLGTEIRMDIGSSSGFQQTDRIASTRGMGAGYCDGWKTGDIAENTSVALKVCLVRGTTEYCSGVYYART
ncbi:hypothetical protein AB0J74_19020 [Asanoa sp. NPDC049573]|uniref:hypothetical protein n=1 Tax=Asanoa sp. NPDC049573 TaxID=3155396 RepID=UPI00343DD64A